MEVPSSLAQTPRWIIALSMLLGLAMVGGAVVAGQIVLHTGDASARESTPTFVAPITGTPPRTVGQPPPPVQNDDTSCTGGCPFPGTSCIDGACRLRPTQRWRLEPDAVLVRGGAAKKSVDICITPAGAPPTCFVAGVNGADSHYRYYTPRERPALVVTTEQLDAQSVEVVVDGVRGMGPVDRFKATPRFFAEKPMIRIAPNGTGVRFNITPVP